MRSSQLRSEEERSQAGAVDTEKRGEENEQASGARLKSMWSQEEERA